MPRCKVTTILTEADRSDVIYRLFLFAANPNENKKEEWGVKIGNGDYDDTVSLSVSDASH
nr:hypothetical protein [Bacteroides acidifaciens]